MNEDDFDFPDIDLDFPDVFIERLSFDDIEIPKNLKPRQRRFLYIVARARESNEEMARKAGISPRTFYNWRDNDPNFREALEYVKAEMEDVAKSNLLANIERGDTRATIFFLTRYCGSKWGTATHLPRKGWN